jgi:hypothetical protein
MSWYKIAQIKNADDIVFDIYSAITNTIDGAWTVLKDRSMMKTYALQSYRIITFDGKNVRFPGDYFWVEVKMFVYKSTNVMHPWDGTYEGANNWQEGRKSSLKEISDKEDRWPKEEEKRRWDALNQMQPEDASTYDTNFGNKLTTFDVLVYGKKPDGKEVTQPVNKLETFFGKGELDKIGSSHEECDTPAEIAQFVNNTINEFYQDDNDDGPDETPYVPTEPNEVENYDEIFNYDPQLVSTSSTSYNWYKKAQQPRLGFKAVAYNPETKTAYSLWGGESHPIDLTINSWAESNSPQGIYLGSSQQFVIDYYSGMTDGEELLLTYSFNEEDALSLPDCSGCDSEIRVKRAQLVGIKHIDKDETGEIVYGVSPF